MDINNNKYVFGFAIAVCLVAFYCLVLRRVCVNRKRSTRIWKLKNILKAVKLEPLTPKMKALEALKVYANKITEEVID